MKLSFLQKINFDEWLGKYMGLSDRDRKIALAGAIVALFIVVVLPIGCATSKLSKMEKQIQNHEIDMDKLKDKIQEFKQIEQKYKYFESRVQPRELVYLSSIMEELTTKVGLSTDKNSRENEAIVDDQYKMITMDVSLSKATLGQLVEFFHAIESYEKTKLKITNLKLKPAWEDKKFMNVNFTIAALVSVKGKQD